MCPAAHVHLEGPGSTSSSLWLHSPATKPPLRVGLLLNGTILASFCARIIEHLQASNFINLELVVCKKPSSSAQSPEAKGVLSSIARRLFNSKIREHTLYDLYVRFDRRKKSRNHPLNEVDCTRLLAGIDSIEVDPIGQKFVHRFPPEALERIRAKNLDVLIRYGFNILRGEILTAARYGVWSYHHGDNDYYRGGAAYFWEVLEGNPVSGAILQVLTEELDAGKVLYKGLFATHAGVSQVRNRVQPYWGASTFVIQKLRELHAHGWDHVERNAVKPAPYRGKKKIYSMPSNVEMLRWLVPLL